VNRGAAAISESSTTGMYVCSTKIPVGSLVESRSICIPSHGGTVSRVMPASRSASLLAIETSGSVCRQ